MITKLTKEQESQIPIFIDKWVAQASKPMNHYNAIKYTRLMYKTMGKKEPIIIFGFSPYNTMLLASLFFILFSGKNKDSQLNNQLNNQLLSQLYSQLHSQLGSQLGNQLLSQLYSQLNSQLYSQLHSQLGSQLGNQLLSQLYSQLNSQLYSQLYSQLGSQLGNQLYSQLNSQLNNQLLSQLYSQLNSQLYSQLNSQLNNQLLSQLRNQLHSQFDSQLDKITNNWYLAMWWLGWCGWYEYGKYIGVKYDMDKYDLFVNFISEISFIIPYDGIAFISEKPINIGWKNRRLHNEKGKSVEYSDGWGIYTLNGISVPEWLVKTPSEKIDPKLALEEKNADVQREIIRKIGPERMLKATNAKTIEILYINNVHPVSGRKKLLYEIKLMKIGDNITRRYLWYEHASPEMKGTFYAKAIPPEAKNIIQMRAFQTGVFGFNPEEAREGLRKNKLTDKQLLAMLPESVQ